MFSLQNALSGALSGMAKAVQNATNPDPKEAALAKDGIAAMLKADPEALAAFENAYQQQVLDVPSENPMKQNAKEAVSRKEKANIPDPNLISRIADELLAQTSVYRYDGENAQKFLYPQKMPDAMVTNKEVSTYPPGIRPQLTGTMMCKDCGPEPAYPMLLELLEQSHKAKTSRERKQAYDMFRAGLDTLDLDPVMYEMIGKNPNSMGHWLPPLIDAVQTQTYFKVPKTILIKVPLTLLQMTRLDYGALSPMTVGIANEFCRRAFELDENREYFIRTGTHSSKFDFRNAHVVGAKEVREIGEYLLFIHNQGLCYAGFGNSPAIYGMATTNEWAVREFIPDKEHNPTIYKGLPLRTEIRAFVDLDKKKVIGIAPYWDPDTMKHRFAGCEDRNDPDMLHDYTIYRMQEELLMSRYEKYKDEVREALESMLPELRLSGQWSLDVMLNGVDKNGKTEVYIIDMALAQNSALTQYVSKRLLNPAEEINWIPDFSEKTGM